MQVSVSRLGPSLLRCFVVCVWDAGPLCPTSTSRCCHGELAVSMNVDVGLRNLRRRAPPGVCAHRRTRSWRAIPSDTALAHIWSLLLDACHSGATTMDGTALASWTKRHCALSGACCWTPATPARRPWTARHSPWTRAHCARPSRRPTWTVLTSSRGNQTTSAGSRAAWQHGAFTKALLERHE